MPSDAPVPFEKHAAFSMNNVWSILHGQRLTEDRGWKRETTADEPQLIARDAHGLRIELHFFDGGADDFAIVDRHSKDGADTLYVAVPIWSKPGNELLIEAAKQWVYRGTFDAKDLGEKHPTMRIKPLGDLRDEKSTRGRKLKSAAATRSGVPSVGCPSPTTNAPCSSTRSRFSRRFGAWRRSTPRKTTSGESTSI